MNVTAKDFFMRSALFRWPDARLAKMRKNGEVHTYMEPVTFARTGSTLPEAWRLIFLFGLPYFAARHWRVYTRWPSLVP
jgi:hypothetical protein